MHSRTATLTSIRSLGGPSFLDLPPEIRLKVYGFAIPDEIVLQTWDFNPDIAERVYIIQLPDSEQPKFICTNKVIQREASPIFWNRVTLDHSFMTTEGKRAIISETSSESHSNETTHGTTKGIKVSSYNASHVQKLIISTQAERFPERIMPCELPSLKALEVRHHSGNIHDRDLSRFYFSARRSGQSLKLDNVVRLHLRHTFNTEAYNAWLTMDLPEIVQENKYQVTLAMTPIRVYQRWSVDRWSGAMQEFQHDATALLRYDCNADTMSCEFRDVETRIEEFQDTVLLVDGDDGDKQRQLYRQTEEVIRVKNMKLLERLVCREIEDRGMIPALSALPGRVAGHV